MCQTQCDGNMHDARADVMEGTHQLLPPCYARHAHNAAGEPELTSLHMHAQGGSARYIYLSLHLNPNAHYCRCNGA